MQLTPFDIVSDDVGERGKSKPKFRGAIIALGDRKHRKYRAVPEEQFKRLDVCHAKWESHTGAQEYVGRVWSGTCFCTEGHGKRRGYIFC